MKKIIAIAFVLLVNMTNAQVTFKPGLRAGAAFSTFSQTHSTYKSDLYIGGFGEIKMSKVYTLQPEITFTQQGSDNVKTFIDNNGTSTVAYKDLEIDYLSFAMINKFTLDGGFQFQFGPTLDFRVQDNLVHQNSDVDLAFISGIAYRLPSGLTFEARFKKGLIDVLDSDFYGSNGNTDYWFGDYNTNVSFQLGISYPFGK
jgi:hypothetical protein